MRVRVRACARVCVRVRAHARARERDQLLMKANHYSKSFDYSWVPNKRAPGNKRAGGIFFWKLINVPHLIAMPAARIHIENK